jgi:hypothetical protein
MDVHVLDTGKGQNVYETTTPMDVHVVDTGKCKNVYETTTPMDVHVLDTGCSGLINILTLTCVQYMNIH